MATILIVDDLAANRTVLVTLLRAQGHRLLEAADGRQGLAVVHAELPDLVITDVLMPVMDGYDFVRQLRLDPSTSRIPVVFYTAHYGEREARALALSSGVAYVLTKPAAAEEVLTIVDRALAGDSESEQPSGASPFTTAFDQEHLRLLTDKLSEHAGELRTANARLRALFNIVLELAPTRDPDRLLESVCVSARDLFGATYVTLGIVNPNDHTVERAVTCDADTPGGVGAAHWIKAGDTAPGILGAVVADRRTLRGDNPGGNPARLQLPWLHLEVRAFVAAAITSPAHVYGWICLVGNEGRSFDESDEHLLMALSAQVGRIYENLSLLSTAQNRADALEREIRERRQAELALRHERDRAQGYLDTAEVILLKLDVDGRIALVNRYACSVLGWTADELHGRDWTGTCLPAHARDAFRQQFRHLLGGDLSIIESPILTRSGEERLIEWRHGLLRDDEGRVSGSFSSGADVTERNRATEALRVAEERSQQTQKMEAIGRLAGGVAHDFNNLLTVILGYCDLLLADIGPDDPRREDMTGIQQAGTRAAGLTHQLLAFSRKQIIEPTLLDLNVLVAGMRPMLGRLIREDVAIVLSLSADPVLVNVDRGQMEQAVLNLSLNARDAMPKGGTLTIETAQVELDEHYATTHAGVKAGAYVALTITDTGTGISPEVQARVFEPFFTTKEVGTGTGLGLATVHGIVAQSGGSVNVYSEVGRGTSFKVYFPHSDADEAVAEARAPVERPRTGTETVLVVEDAEGLRHLARKLLERQGYTVLVAANADEALQQFGRHESIDVLLTDVVMPGASGPELIRRLAGKRHVVKVIYMSGYTEDAIVQHGVLKPGIAFLHKPFTADALGWKIREVLDSKGSRSLKGARLAGLISGERADVDAHNT